MRRTALAVLILTAATAFGGVNVWTTSGPEGVQAVDITVDPNDPDVLYVRTSAGIYRTTDGAADWVPANEGLKSTLLNTFVVAGGESTALYAPIDGEVWASTDRGDHWSRQGGIEGAVIRSMAFDRKHRTLYAVTDTLFASVDGGITWKGVVMTPSPGSVYSIQVSATAVYAQGYAQGFGGTVSSTDGGATWTQLTALPSSTIFTSPESPALFAVSSDTIFVSADDGKTWTQLPRLASTQILSVRMAGSTIYAATTDGVDVYDSAAKSWTLLGAGRTWSMAIPSTSPLRMYATTDSGVVTYTPSGFIETNRGLPHPPATSVAITERTTTAYASSLQAIFRTDDVGQSWRMVMSSGGDLATSPDAVYAATDGGVVKSADGGTTWKTVSPSSRFSLTRVAVAHSDPATLYAVLSAGMWKSTNSGDTWSSITSGIYYDYYDYYGFTTTAMAVNPADANNVAIAKYNGFYVTRDGGARWEHLSPESNISALAIDPDSTIYAARKDVGILKSGNFGQVWTNVFGLTDKRVTALAMDSATLFAGTADGRLYRSADGGAFWDALEDGLSRGSIHELAVAPSGDRLYAATAAGFYEIDLRSHVLNAAPFAASRAFDDYFKGAAAVIPVAGKATGADATVYTTGVTLSNYSEGPQAVILAWLPLGSADPTFFHTALAQGDTTILDINEELGVSGIGALAVFAVNGEDAPEINAAISGSARIWSHVADSRAPFAQSIDAATAALLETHGRARIDGIAPGAMRINVGIVNLSSEVHSFTVANITLTVPPRSLVQVPLGDLPGSMEVVADSKGARWITYASAIRSTGEAQTILGQPAN